MTLTSDASLADVARSHRIEVRDESFIRLTPVPLGDEFVSELAFTIRATPFASSLEARRESLVYPLLREVWKPFRGDLTLWINDPAPGAQDARGLADYVLARRSRLGPFLPEPPYLLTVVVHLGDEEGEWGHCLAALLAARRANREPSQTLFGVSTDGLAWRFVRLQEDLLVREPRPCPLRELSDLAGALHFLFAQCRDEAARSPAIAD
jgi:hypothetical protein